MRKTWLVTFVLLLLAVVYLSLRSRPAIVSVPLFPHLFAVWVDHHDIIKNLIGFGALAVAGFRVFLPRPGAVSVRRRVVTSVCLMGCILLLITALELAQTRLPQRTCDPRDLLAGGVGVVLAWIGAAVGRDQGTKGPRD